MSPSTTHSAENSPHEAFDRAARLRTRPAELDALGPTCLVLPLWRSKSLVSRGDVPRPVLLSASDAGELIEQAGDVVFLGLRGGQAVLAIDLPPAEDTPSRPELDRVGQFADLRWVGGQLEPQDVSLLAYARGMLSWHRRQQRCGKCGGETASDEGGHVRVCRDCEEKHFPRTDPAIMALVLHGDPGSGATRCLLARQPRFPPGMYSVLAGFVEPGETLEEAAIREVGEEVGLEVEGVRYLRSQPWPFPSSLMVGFVARARDEAVTLDRDELEHARWVSRAELREPQGFFVPPRFSLAGQLIGMFLEGELD